jgi:ATP-dependent Clp protease protease subunit
MAKLNRDDIEYFFEYGIYIPTKTIYIGRGNPDPEADCDVDELLAERVTKGLHILDQIRPDDPINIVINNRGGDTQHGLAIYDAIRHCLSPVHAKLLGSAESMGAWVFQAADTRLMSKHSRLMLHIGTTSHSDHATNVEQWRKRERLEQDLMDDLILKRIKAKKPNYTMASLKKRLTFDWILSAEEAVEWGLADGIIEQD